MTCMGIIDIEHDRDVYYGLRLKVLLTECLHDIEIGQRKMSLFPFCHDNIVRHDVLLLTRFS